MIKYFDIQKITTSFQPRLREKIDEVIRSGRYLYGPNIHLFEQAFAQYIGVKHCVCVGNGYDALTIILKSLRQRFGWKDGDEIIVPSMTFVATADSVRRVGLKPVFCDIEAKTYQIDAQKISSLLSAKSRAILPVHLYGRACDLLEIQRIAVENGLLLIEDACQAHGLTLKGGTKAGSKGIASAFSFYPGKNLGALSDGGAIVTNDSEIADDARQLANYGSSEKYTHQALGLNSRLDEIQAAVLQLKLKRLDKDNQHRANIAEAYINGINNKEILPYGGDISENVWHIFPICVKDRKPLQQYLLENGVETLIHYPIPLHAQPSYHEYNSQHFPVAEKVAKEELSLPISPSLSEEEVAHIIHTINNYHW